MDAAGEFADWNTSPRPASAAPGPNSAASVFRLSWLACASQAADRPIRVRSSMGAATKLLIRMLLVTTSLLQLAACADPPIPRGSMEALFPGPVRPQVS